MDNQIGAWSVQLSSNINKVLFRLKLFRREFLALPDKSAFVASDTLFHHPRMIPAGDYFATVSELNFVAVLVMVNEAFPDDAANITVFVKKLIAYLDFPHCGPAVWRRNRRVDTQSAPKVEHHLRIFGVPDQAAEVPDRDWETR